MLPFSELGIRIDLPQYTPLPAGYECVGQLLKEYRAKGNLSLSEVARKLGVSASNIKYWEDGGMPNVKGYTQILNQILNFL